MLEQMKGRSARMGQEGSYSVIVKENNPNSSRTVINLKKEDLDWNNLMKYIYLTIVDIKDQNLWRKFFALNLILIKSYIN